MKQKCPACGKKLFVTSTNAAYPFCCERCRLIDLGGWLDEKNSIPSCETADTEPMPLMTTNFVKH